MENTYFILSLCFCALAVSEKVPVSFDDALLFKFLPQTFNGTWISSNEYIYENQQGVTKYNVETDQYTVILNSTMVESLKSSDVRVSADGTWLAVEHDRQSVFRHSSTCRYTLIELNSGNLVEIAEKQQIQLLVWAPAGNGFAFVRENDIFYQSSPTASALRITNSSPDVYNGVADWVYEEEVLGSSKALWFSPEGTKLVFATLNDSKVRNVTFWKYGDPSDIRSQYAQEVVIRYPKVGTRNPVAYLNYVNLKSESLEPAKVNAPEDLVTSDNIMGPVEWADDDHFSMTWMERLQTKGYTLLCSTEQSVDCKVVYEYKEDHGWLDMVDLVWVNSSAFLTIMPQDQGGDLGNYRQLSMVKDGNAIPLTSGNSVVTSIDCYDTDKNTVYFTSTVDGDSARKHVYKLSLTNSAKECFSCKISETCVSGMASFSKSCANAVLTCKGSDIPQFHIYSKEGQLLHELGNNNGLRQRLQNVEVAPRKDLTVPLPEGFTARVRLLLPPGLDESGNTKYPLLFYVYSGPDTNKVTDIWPVPAWDDYLATSRGVIIAYLDGRGSGLRGDKLKFALYHKLGGPEIDDILIVGKYLQDTFPWVDRERTAIWGWSYGGFAAAMTLAKDSENIFKCAISVAPVTHWIYYDTVYTERYMGLPTKESNLEGYQHSDICANVSNFRNKQFYLIHGNADDNVHYQQSMMLSRALELADILFYQQSYPDETHALSRVRRHLYHSMDRFWTRCFHLNHPTYTDPSNSLSYDYYS